MVNSTFPADLADAERESRRQREHVVSETVRFSVSVEVLECGRPGKFHQDAYSPGYAVLALYAV